MKMCKDNFYVDIGYQNVQFVYYFAFSVAYTKCVATILHGRIYLPTRVERLSRGLVSHTCTHCGPILFLDGGCLWHLFLMKNKIRVLHTCFAQLPRSLDFFR